MRNNTFLICELSERNVFNIWLDTELHSIHNICKAKIDTGCTSTSVPIKTFLGSETSNGLALSLKRNAIDLGLDYSRGYDVSDTSDVRKKDRFLIKSGNLLDCTSVGFIK